MRVGKILDNECRDFFFTAVTRVFSHLHLHETRFDLGSVIPPVPAEARDRSAQAVKGPVEVLVRKSACVTAPSSPGAAEADHGQYDSSDVDHQPPAEGATGRVSS
ncbi:hypothetical protein D1007_12265 [Hordeum vulgare]|nr:hypothetical protein D1007_12265 [Hordeum vulgare]